MLLLSQFLKNSYKLLFLVMAMRLKPPIPGIEREGHFTFRNLPDKKSSGFAV